MSELHRNELSQVAAPKTHHNFADRKSPQLGRNNNIPRRTRIIRSQQNTSPSQCIIPLRHLPIPLLKRDRKNPRKLS